MRKAVLTLTMLVLLSGTSNAAYFLTDHWGGTWYDAEKTWSNTEDDLMCWAAATANMLTWTKWSAPYVTGDADAVFSYYQDHWSDLGGNIYYGVDWWFSGENDMQGVSGWSQEDVDGGGGFYPTLNFENYYKWTTNDSQAKSAIETYMNEGRATGLSIATASGGGHAVTAWGYGIDDDGLYKVWLTDSDNSKGSDDPLDLLLSYVLLLDGGKWYLQDYAGSDKWYISEVHGLLAAAAPIPGAVWLLGTGLLGLLGLRKRVQG